VTNTGKSSRSATFVAGRGGSSKQEREQLADVPLSTEQEAAVPVYIESIAGSLIDSARISVVAALAMLPPPNAPLIILPGTSDQMADDAAASTHGCLEQAMEWLDAARIHSAGALAAKGAPPTSFHVAGGGR
jgi:hypothetical protein